MKFAQVYGRAGFRVLPIHDVTSGACSCGQSPCPSAGKHPRLKTWQNDASADEAVIAEWARRYPRANIGLASGAEFFALDVDPKNGGPATLAALVEIHGELPETPQQTTGSGGSHYLFQPVAGISNSAGKLGAGLDTRGEGGQIVVAPSVSLVGAYSWVSGRAPWEIPLAPAPQWLIDALRTVKIKPSRIGASAEERGFFPAASPEILEQAALALEIHGPAIDGDGGGLHTVQAAAILTHDFALTEDEAWPLFEAWNDACERIDRGPDWLREKFENGRRYGKAEFGRCRALDAVETARKLINDWQDTERTDASMWELITRCRRLAAISADSAKRAVISRELQGATGIGARDLNLPAARAVVDAVKPPGSIDVGPKLAEMADAALAAIAPKLFARNGVLCEVIPGDRPGRTFISDLSTPRVQDLMSSSAKWVRTDDKGIVEQAAPEAVAKILNARRAHAQVRVLEAVTTAPIFLADGSILSERGYNAQARVFLEPSCSVDVADEPSLADAQHAVFILRDLVCDYDFAGEADFSAWLAGVLSPLVKSATGNANAPLFLVSAASRGAGKTKLAQLAAIIVTGAKVGTATYSAKDPGEWVKKLTSHVRGGAPMVLFDNMPIEFGDEDLDRLLTGGSWVDRILGVSEAPPMPIVTTWWGTGNNTEARNDTVRRVLPIRIEVTSERPQERSGFKRDELEPFAEQYRATYLTQALTILRAWHCAGRPTRHLPTWGSFETWSSIVRQALVWAGCADPFINQQLASATLNEPENFAHDFWLDVIARCPDGAPETIAITANARGAQEKLGAREALTAHRLPKWIGQFIDRPRSRRRIRRLADPMRYVIEAIR